MASIILSTAGAAVGGSVGGPIGAIIGQQVGSAVGGVIDDAIFGVPTRSVEGPRLADLSVQVSTYGKMVPLVYGTVRIAGNVIWSRPIKETTTTTTSSSGGGKGGGGGTKTTATTFSYSVSLAIALCEGEITEVLRVWADAKQLDLSQGTYRIYKGDESQLADPFIESFEGVGSTPAYRGTAYVVIEDFPLGDFGNRIPNFTFEVKKTLKYPDYGGQSVEDMVQGMVVIPGAGEFVYDTQIETKIPGEQAGSEFAQGAAQQLINQHTPAGKANALVSLDQLEETCPNVGWVAVVVSWFGDSLDAGTCILKPGVEYQTGATTSPDTWAVAGFTRSTARQITLIDGSPQYGGTPDDDSILRYLDELNDRGYNILFLPLFFMDVADKPWRGRLTGSAANVNSFFTKPNGYNAFVTHYANLVAAKVDAFAIGSELIGLTKVTDTPGNYPAVNQLVSLAATVKGIVGGGVKVTYAADWSEYHHTDGGWYNLDPLWASANIDVVGIDAYFPLTDAPQQALGYDVQTVIDGWTEGEGYDWYYSDPGRTVQTALAPAYAWKNIAWWWNNAHVNPDASTTPWSPGSKKIWFCEYGFPSVDGATNQPNVFYDPTSSESFFPYHSRGQVDFRAQRVGITATLAKWAGSSMIERMFLWTWDARPFPYFPDLLSVWADGGNWVTGHWVTGKFGLSALAAIVRDLSNRAGLEDADIDVSALTDRVEGYVVTRQNSVRRLIEELMAGYFFDAAESDNKLKFVPRGRASVATIAESNLVREGGARPLAITRRQELELPREENVIYINRTNQYQPGTQLASRESSIVKTQDAETLNLPIVFADSQAKSVADITLYLRWMERTGYQFMVNDAYAALEPTDVITITEDAASHTIRITKTLRDRGRTRVEGVAEDVSVYASGAQPGDTPNVVTPLPIAGETILDPLDLPAFPSDTWDKSYIRFAAAGVADTWRGTIVYRSDDGGANYGRVLDIEVPAALGTALTVLGNFTGGNVFDNTNSVTVLLVGESELDSMTELAVLNGSNAAMLGGEIIQFKTATLVAPGKYTLTGLLRGRLGTEWAINTHAIGERFVLLDGRIAKDLAADSLIGAARQYKPVTLGATLGSTTAQAFTFTGVAYKPYAPVQVTGARDGSSNLTINWIRRTRLGGDWRDLVDVPLSEAGEKYEVDIMNGGNVVRTLTATTPTAAYSAATQTTDFGSPQPSVSVKVYQLSEKIGRGYGASVSV